MPVVEITAEHECTHVTPVHLAAQGGARLPAGPLELRPDRGGPTLAVQRLGDGLVTLVERMKAGERRRYHLVSGAARSGVRLKEESPHALSILLPDGLFTTYHTAPTQSRPFLHPVLGPGGLPVTRDFPMKDVPEEKASRDQDHPHHRSFWTAFDEVSGVDNWSETAGKHGYTRHQEFVDKTEGPVWGGFRARASWTARDGRKILDEVRAVRVYNVGSGFRLLDYNVNLAANHGDAEFHDTKEGGILAWRVFHTMKEDQGGRMVNSVGQSGEKNVWGKPASWLDYSGQVKGRTVGVAMMDHPGNTNHPPRWHARAYGLVGVNPFSVGSFEPGKPKTTYRLKSGDELKFRYRVYIHPGDAAQAEVEEVYHCWVQAPEGRVIG